MQKILISVFCSREMQHDETNRAWWSGKWYGRGLGTHAMSQPAREFVVKIVEMSLWSGDFILGHLLLFILTPPLLLPFVDRVHSTMLCKSYIPLISFSEDHLTALQSGSARQSRFVRLCSQGSKRDSDGGLSSSMVSSISCRLPSSQLWSFCVSICFLLPSEFEF